jgi:lipoate---protein ligase
MANWLIYPLSIADQQVHIDQSERLLREAQPEDPPILYWSLAEPTGIVLGFSQKPTVLNPHPNAELLASGTMPVYHRRAGGTAVLVGSGLLSLDVVLPAGHPLILSDIVESYRWLGAAWVQTLQAFGVATRTVSPEEAHNQQALRRQPSTRDYELLLQRSCYGSLSPYEVAVGKRKIVGLDMVRRRTGSLLQAGLLLQWDVPLLAQLLGHTPAEQDLLREGLAERAVGLDTLISSPIEINDLISVFEQVVISTTFAL